MRKAMNGVIAIRARRASLLRRCTDHTTVNTTRGMSHVEFPKNTARKQAHARYRNGVPSVSVEQADIDMLALYCGTIVVKEGEQDWGSAA